jgi:hypothetical protein
MHALLLVNRQFRDVADTVIYTDADSYTKRGNGQGLMRENNFP